RRQGPPDLGQPKLLEITVRRRAADCAEGPRQRARRDCGVAAKFRDAGRLCDVCPRNLFEPIDNLLIALGLPRQHEETSPTLLSSRAIFHRRIGLALLSSGAVLQRLVAAGGAHNIAHRPVASSIAPISRRAINGLRKYATQPAFIASPRAASSSIAVMKMMGTREPDAFRRRCRSIPDMPPTWISTTRPPPS